MTNHPFVKFTKIHLLCLILILGSLSIDACGSIPETYYYTLAPGTQVSAGDSQNNHTPLNLVLGIGRFDAEVLYDDDRIIYRESPVEVKYYNYRRWAATPKYLVTDEIVNRLQQSHLFRDVVILPSTTQIDYILRGRIMAFEEWDRDGEWYGKVAFTVQLYEASSKKLAWSQRFEAEAPAKQKLPAAVVEAISASLDQCATELEKALANVLKS